MSLFSQPNIPLGLDISERSLKLISLTKKKGQLKISSYNEIDLPEDFIVAGEIKEKDKLIESIEKLIKGVKGKTNRYKTVISCLPEPQTFIKLIDVEKTDQAQQKEIIEKEIIKHIPIAPEESYIDWQKIRAENDKIRVLVAVAPKKIVAEHINLLKAAGLQPLALEIEAQAITRALIKPSQEETKTITLAFLDLGASRSSFIAANNQTIFFTMSLPISGREITQKISQNLNIAENEAEAIKIQCGCQGKTCQPAVKNIMAAAISEITTNIKSSIAFFTNHFPQEKNIEEIILCGGGANLFGLEEILTKELNLKIQKANPFTCVTLDDKLNSVSADKFLPYITAIGLALRNNNHPKK